MLNSTSLTLTLMVTLVASASTFAGNKEQVLVHQIKDWKATSNQELIIETYEGKFYRAKTFNQCVGLRTAEDLAFVTRGSNSVDSFSSIVLTDGTRCRFSEFEPYDPETADAATTSDQ